VVVLLIVIIGVFFCMRRFKFSFHRRQVTEKPDVATKPELPDYQVKREGQPHEVDGQGVKHEIGAALPWEMPAEPLSYEEQGELARRRRAAALEGHVLSELGVGEREELEIRRRQTLRP
jgi:hypothetical protein